MTCLWNSASYVYQVKNNINENWKFSYTILCGGTKKKKKKEKEPLYNFSSKFEQSESVHIKHSHEFK